MSMCLAFPPLLRGWHKLYLSFSSVKISDISGWSADSATGNDYGD